MKGVKSLSAESFRTSFLVFYVLSSLLPILILMYIISQYVRPHLTGEQIQALMDPVTYGLIAMLVVPLFGIVLMSLWIKSLERLKEDVKSKAEDVMQSKIEVDGRNEIVFLQHHMNGLYGELKGKIKELNEQSAQLEASKKKINQMAYYDDLTSVYKRRLFDGKLMEQIKKAEKGKYNLSLAMFDLAGFKKYNHLNGHGAGDVLLRKVGELLREQTKKIGIPFRYGGDEFALILPKRTIEETASIAKKLVDMASNIPIQNNGSKERTSLKLNCGVVSYSSGFKGLFIEADRCISEANSAGHGRVVCLHPEHQE